MKDEKYMSGSELRQYLHISTRKLKYLMDHDYIPHENTGHTTYKYRIKIEDAVSFKNKSENEEGFLCELSGMFTSRKERLIKAPLIEATEGNSLAFRAYLTKEWAEYPDALPTSTASKLSTCQPQRIHEMIRNGKLHGCKVGATQYCAKEEIITYTASVKRLSNPTGDTYKELIRAFKRRQCRERENEKRREKRKSK